MGCICSKTDNGDFIIETATKEYACLASVHDCDKNLGHVGFYSLEDLDKNYMKILPVGCRTEKWLNFIRDYSKRIVKLTVTKPDGTRLLGTGCVYMRRGVYCHSDSHSDSDSDKFCIVTNKHVIGSQEDVSNCIVEWFYDTEDRAGIETSCGVKLIACHKELDVCCFRVNYIPETVKQLFLHPPDIPPVTKLDHIIAISHPHGAPKTITFGKRLGMELVDGVVSDIHTAKTCGGCSGTRLIYTRYVNYLDDWRYPWYTHYAGQPGKVYNIEGWREVTSDTNNINYSVLEYIFNN